MSEARLRILMVEDEKADAILIQRELRRQGMILTVRRVERDDAFIRALREFAPDLVLSDYALPGFSGLEALAMLRKECPGVPLIFVSGTVGEEQAVELLKMGATDYVLKDNLARLPAAINRALREARLESEGRRTEECYRAILEKLEGGAPPLVQGAAGQVPVGVAHELNNVLAAIPMAVSMLRTGLPDAERERMLAIIETSAKRASGIVRGTLAAGRGGGDETERRGFALDPVIRDVFQKLPKTWPDTLRVKLHVGENLQRVAGDAARVGQMILDLCVRAGNTLPDGGELHLGVANRREEGGSRPVQPPGVTPGDYVVVEIGGGGGEKPSAEEPCRSFDPFFGTRPGVERCVGFILAGHPPGEGSTTRIYLPALRETARKTVPAAPPPVANAEKPAVGPGGCVLLADDEETIRFAAKAVLTKNGYRVLTATDGAEAWQAFNAHAGEIALVLTDVMMPVMDGLALVRAIRQVDPSVRIIASSGQNETARLAELRAAGVDTILDKPYAADILLRTVGEVLGKRPGAR